MAGITHKFVSAKGDGGDTTLVRPSNWNDTHVLGPGTIKVTEQDFGSGQTYFASWAISDADVQTTSRINAYLSTLTPAALRDGVAADGDEAEWEPMEVYASNIASGSFTLTAEVRDGPVTGPYKFSYLIG